MIHSICPECKSDLKTDLGDINVVCQECTSCSWEGDYIDSLNRFNKCIMFGPLKIKQFKNGDLMTLNCYALNNNTGANKYWVGNIMTGMKMICVNNNEFIVVPKEV